MQARSYWPQPVDWLPEVHERGAVASVLAYLDDWRHTVLELVLADTGAGTLLPLIESCVGLAGQVAYDRGLELECAEPMDADGASWCRAAPFFAQALTADPCRAHRHAAYKLGVCYLYGLRCIGIDTERAVALLELAVASTSVWSEGDVSWCACPPVQFAPLCRHGRDQPWVPPPPAATDDDGAGHVDGARSLLGSIYYDSHQFRFGLNRSLQLLLHAEYQEPLAQRLLAKCYRHNFGCLLPSPDPSLADQLEASARSQLLVMAQRGDIVAQYWVGLNDQVPPATARLWWQVAFRRGHVQSGILLRKQLLDSVRLS